MSALLARTGALVHRSVLTALLVSLLAGAFASGAPAAVRAARWAIRSAPYPSDFTTHDNPRCESTIVLDSLTGCDTYVVTVTNVGGKETGSPTVTLKDSLPPGLVVRNVALFLGTEVGVGEEVPFVCKSAPVQCVISKPLKPDESLNMDVSVLVTEPANPATLVNSASVSGGGVEEGASTSSSNTLESGTPPFGPNLLEASFVGLDGRPDTQAGGHPAELHTTIGLNTVFREDPHSFIAPTSVEDVRDAVVDLPPGMAGSAVSAARCTLAQLSSPPSPEETGGPKIGRTACPRNTIVGHLLTVPERGTSAYSPIYNLLPDRGHTAELGFIDITGAPHVLDVSLAPTPAGYVLRTSATEVTQLAMREIVTNVFGNPAAREHTGESLPPTFTSPSQCSGEPLVTTVHMDSWQHPGRRNPDGTPDLSDPNWVSATSESPPVTGCEALEGMFEPSLQATPDTTRADTPAGLDVSLTVPQHVGAEELATPPLKEAIVTLPEGVTVNPSSANGLGACSEEQLGISPAGVPNAAPPRCPDSSKLGTLEVETPALPAEACTEPVRTLQECPEPAQREKTPLHGAIYLATENENPFGSLIALYFVIDDPRTGVVVKIPARVSLDEHTGQLTTVVPNSPQLPFSQLRTHFFDGPTAALRTPAACGSYTVASELTPWSAPATGPPATPSSAFEVSQGADGGACQAPGFAPSFSAGTTSNTAGEFGAFGVTFSRNDGEQSFAGTTVTMPPGVSGILTGLPLCEEPQAANGQCPEASLIGQATAAVGAGPNPYWVKGGKVYLTGPYGGGPFGLSIVVPTTAGPFTLTGNAGLGKEVVRASVRVDPLTAQVTAVSDPLPTIIQGIPLDVRTVNVTVDRPRFIFNPTSCNPLSVTGTLSSTGDVTTPVSSRYQASDCSKLAFKPKFTVSTSGKTSRQKGASLHTLLVYPKAPFGSQANIVKVKVDLPKQLPSNLKTLQKACTHQVFETNPAACPAESHVGEAKATTPLLPVPLTGPAYFVSYGGAKFPELVIVLQGYGITVDLHGETFIDEHTNITSSTFKSVPDVPVGTFELNLPQGKYSALAAPAPLCGKKLTMPTLFVAQDGATIKQATKIAIGGCPKHKAKRPKAKRHKTGKRKKKH
jgi:hypothetical protein